MFIERIIVRYKAVAISFAAFFFLTSMVNSEILLPPWPNHLFSYVENEYGADAANRLHYLQDLILTNQDLSVMEKLKVVNSTLNKLPWIADSKHWKSVDYWATPLQTITTFGGDCEDIAITKWFVLNHLGIPNDYLRLAVVKFKGDVGDHMVLLYLENPAAQLQRENVYVLDNLDQQVRKGSERTDLLASYIIDKDGNMLEIIKEDANPGKIEDLGRREIRQLEDLKRRIAQNREEIRNELSRHQEIDGSQGSGGFENVDEYQESRDGPHFMPLSL